MRASVRSSYDDVAAMYHALWADWYLPAALPALTELFFARVPAGSRVLDVCCGSGHVTKELVARGYFVAGVDNSEGLISLARRALPQVQFDVQDVRCLHLDQRFRAALSTFDSLNHLLSLEELKAAFGGIRHTLEPGGLFVFDMNLEQAYATDSRQWSVDVQERNVGLVQGTFDPLRKRATTELIWFVKNEGTECWRQQRSTVEQQCYSQAEILAALSEVGFREIESTPAPQAGVTAELGFGRMFFSAIAP